MYHTITYNGPNHYPLRLLFSSTVNVAFNRGLVVEPSGAAALAALLTGKVHFIYSTGKINYYVLISYSQLETLIGQDNLLGQRVVAVITG